MSTTAALRVEREGAVLVVVLDRPQAANAIDQTLNNALVGELDLAQRDDAVRAVVMTASGSRAFCAGADVKEFADLEPGVAARRRRALLVRTLEAFIDFDKPLIAAVQAAALGAGCMLAMLADEVIAAEAAQFGMPEIRRGMPSPIGYALVVARGGPAPARQLIQRGDPVDARQAQALGLVDEVVEPDRLRSRAIERAVALAAHPCAAFSANKRFINSGIRTVLHAAVAEAERLQDASRRT